jgi:hypothetical protein
MQIKICSTFILFLSLIGFSSCKKWMDLKPEDGIVKQEFWKSKEDVQSAVIGCYASLLGPAPGVTDRPLADYLFMWGELRADMVVTGTYATEDERDIANMNILPTNPLCNWAAFYRVINYCNSVIDLAPGVMQNDPTFKQEELDGFLAEALTIRAYMYFTLARTFGDVPLKLNATISDADNFQIPQSSQADVLKQVAADLVTAESKAVVTYGNNAYDKGRITKYTINAMQADVYLWLGEYDNAITACDKVINSGKFALIPATDSWFTTVYANGNSTESIFEFQYDLQKLNTFYDMFLNRPRYFASGRVMEEVFGIDYQDDTKKDIRGDRASLVASDNYIYKYVGLNNRDRKSLEQSDTHWFVYRYADVLLMKAEALNQVEKGEDALKLIAEVRERAKALDQTEMSPLATDKDGITDYILAERAREFAFEGKRWFDVLRNARRDNYARLDILLTMAAYSAPSDRQQSILAKLQDKNSHYLPVYLYELQTNKALVQNPFYK